MATFQLPVKYILLPPIVVGLQGLFPTPVDPALLFHMAPLHR